MSETSLSHDDLCKLKVSELKKLCNQLSISSVGCKSELIARLLVKEDASNEPSTIHLQPEDEAELLGDIEERDNIAVKVNLKHKLDIDQEVIETIQANSATSIIESQNSLPIKISYANGESGSPSKKMLVCIEEKLLGSGVSKLNDKERLLARAQRFGSSGGGHCSGSLHSDEQLAARARRFGLPVAPNGASATIESRETSVVDKLKKRAERFGVTTSKKLELATDAEKLALRAIKFDLPSSKLTDDPTDIERKKKARLNRFGASPDPKSTGSVTSSLNQDRLAKRLARFGSLTQT